VELRHLRYFTAVVQWRGYREASRRLNIAQPAISQTVADLEQELGLKLFSRAGRKAELTPEGKVFYIEAMRTIEHAESAIDIAKRAARGEIGQLSVGFIGSATYLFLPGLVRSYKAQHPGVKLTLRELSPSDQDTALDSGLIDIGFTRALAAERSKKFTSLCLYRDPMLAVLPASRKLKTRTVRVADLAHERFVLFHRAGALGLYDAVVGLCNDAGFSPMVEYESDRAQTVVTLVEAEQGVSIVPASLRNLWTKGVRFYRLQPDDVRIALVAAWKTEAPSVALRAFIELVKANAAHIRKKAELA
jgi:DNA-binding transcriptional LysR family regulator